MSISSVSSTTPAYQPPQQDPTRQSFQQLTQALQSGDLASAQGAYTTLIQNQPAQGANGASNSSNPFQQGLASIGAALQSGNLSGAQQALQTLQGQMKGAHHGHHHHHGAGQSQQAGSASSSTTSTTSSAPTASSPSVSVIA
jgi:hypothetical protein